MYAIAKSVIPVCRGLSPTSLLFRPLVFKTLNTNVFKHHKHIALRNYLSGNVNTRSVSSNPLRVFDPVLFHQVRQKYLQHVRHFKTSKPRLIIPILPATWAVVKPFAKVASIIAGRYIRKTYQGLSPEKQLRFRQRYKEYIGKLAIVLCIAFIANYNYHLVETPITHRKRYIAFTDDQVMKVCTEEANKILEKVKPYVLHPKSNSTSYKQVLTIVNKIVDCNQDLEFFQNQKWTIVVVKSPEANAFVLPTGHIFVFTGLLEFADTEDKLAVVLGHELAHALLQHGCEKLGMAQLLDYMIIFVMAAIWTVMPSDGIALITQWFYHKVVHLLLNLPFSRKLEREADIVGLELIAKACYDVREASNFWNLMYINSEIQQLDAGAASLPEWVSTHPASEKRAMTLETLIPQAIKRRTSCHCCELPSIDPRSEGQRLLSRLEEIKIMKEKQLLETNS